MQSKKKQRNKRNKGHTFKNKTEGGDKGARLAGFVKDGASALRMQLQKRRAPTKLTSAFKSVATNIKNKAKMATSGKYSLKKEFIETIKKEMENMLLTFERVGFKIPATVDGAEQAGNEERLVVNGNAINDSSISAEQIEAARIASEKQEDNTRTVEADARKARLEELKLPRDALEESIEAARIASEDTQRTENYEVNTMSNGGINGGTLPNNSPEELQTVYDILDDFNKIRNKYGISNNEELKAAKEYETKFASYVKFLEFIKESISKWNLKLFEKEQCIKAVDKQIGDINMIIEENERYIQLFTFGSTAPKSKPDVASGEQEQVASDNVKIEKQDYVNKSDTAETEQTIKTLTDRITELEATLAAKDSELETEQQKIVTEMSKKPEYETFNITDEIQNEIPLLVKDETKGEYMLHVVMGTDKVRLWYALQDGSNPTIKYEVTGDLGFKEARNKLEAAVKEKNAAAPSL